MHVQVRAHTHTLCVLLVLLTVVNQKRNKLEFIILFLPESCVCIFCHTLCKDTSTMQMEKKRNPAQYYRNYIYII